ncbi:uncharacterized protein MAM_03644 [Metarhizium album ARSEF 1941]|uniref:Uncharacterized protein n=1 Tax=Metarhizium album (strain ARSEF 1941) TaxID=1081103 RepID=A0A0B2X098_METAS|nr:uncharacterized protein MAM_03644 [Metarhizium album ARSEF 1941]KHN98520.1 hypothetical protein MAM_03644 [Metarhizium album ARSEF 1941]
MAAEQSRAEQSRAEQSKHLKQSKAQAALDWYPRHGQDKPGPCPVLPRLASPRLALPHTPRYATATPPPPPAPHPSNGLPKARQRQAHETKP